MMQKIRFPNDENGDVLRRMQSCGDDLSQPRGVDFYFAFENQIEAENFVEQVDLTTGLSAKASRYEERQMWQASVIKHMVPTHQEITSTENALGQIAKLYNGEPDGWGCFKRD